uniref:Glutathione transferase n=1 Tax=Alexandrium catenella TaxID=2925 RepID=A0A7S1WUL4_ALECA
MAQASPCSSGQALSAFFDRWRWAPEAAVANLPMAEAKPKLTYFRAKGRAELTRLIFAAGAVAYEDDRVAHDEMKRRKAAGELPFGQFPVLTVDGRSFAQSYSIAKYAAKVAGLMPADPLVALEVESIVDATDDVRTKFVPIRYMPISAEERLGKYADFFSTTLPPWLERFDRLLAKGGQGGFFVGGGLTLADLAIFNMCDYLTNPSCEVQAASPAHAEMGAKCLEPHAALKAHAEMVAALPRVAEWLARRPRTPHDNVLTLTEADYA